MTVLRSLARTVAFSVAYVIATVLGRMTVMDNTNLSLIWPAAGVGVIWFCAQRASRTRWADVAALAVITVIVNTATGASFPQALVFVAANLAQVGVFRHVIRRWRPNLWGAGGDSGLSGPRDLWGLLAASFVSTACGAGLGTTGMWLLSGEYSWPSAAVWLARNTASVLLVGAVGLRVGHGMAVWRRDGGSVSDWFRGTGSALRSTPPWRTAEYVALALASTTAYLAGFDYSRGLPVDFALIAVTVWAAVRLSTTFVVLHDLAVGTIAVLFTLDRDGPFAAVQSHAARAIIAQMFVATVAVVGLVLALGRDERAALVAQLAAEKRDALRQATLLGAIIDTMNDGLAVVDADGEVVIRNPAAVRLLAGRTSPDNRLSDPDFYGFQHLDGSPIPHDETAYAQALAGRDVHDSEMMIRNPGVPDGRILRVTATALPDGHGTRSAVVLFHDVTADHRHRDELANFAGVVAHDLMNPLTTVEGWTQATTDTLRDAPGDPAVAQALSNLIRVDRAASRMRGLINDLLSYTTSRDASLAPAPIGLTALIADIATGRTDAALAAGLPAPVFEVDTPESVEGDPVLVRQLLDNLIGNSVKYTAPGVTPRIRISARRVGAEVEMQVSDNGIGIPAGQHDAIFGTFHRAHHHSGYAGTGLGLAICKRIVERHGGTINASDNQRGGSVFTFTLPAAARTPATSERQATFLRVPG